MNSKSKIKDVEQIGNKLLFSKRLSWVLKWKTPLYRIPKLSEYSQLIIDHAEKTNTLPFYNQFDINKDGQEEIMLIQRSVIGGPGRLLIVSIENDEIKIDRIKWNRPVNALFFDYRIELAESREYEKFGLIDHAENMNSSLYHRLDSSKVVANHAHILTKGFISRIVYWNGKKYNQERVSTFELGDE